MATTETSDEPLPGTERTIEQVYTVPVQFFAVFGAILVGIFTLQNVGIGVALSTLFLSLMAAIIWNLAIQDQNTHLKPSDRIHEAIKSIFGLEKEKRASSAKAYAEKKALLLSAVQYLTEGRQTLSLSEDIDLAIEVVRAVSRLVAGKGLQAVYNERITSFGASLNAAHEDTLSMSLRLEAMEKTQLDDHKTIKMLQDKLNGLTVRQYNRDSEIVSTTEPTASSPHNPDLAALLRRIQAIEKLLPTPQEQKEAARQMSRRAVDLSLRNLKASIMELEQKQNMDEIDCASRSDWIAEGIVEQDKKIAAVHDFILVQNHVLKELVSENMVQAALLERNREDYKRVVQSIQKRQAKARCIESVLRFNEASMVDSLLAWEGDVGM